MRLLPVFWPDRLRLWPAAVHLHRRSGRLAERLAGLLLGIGIFIAWCLAMIPATCDAPPRLVNGVQFYFASIARDRPGGKCCSSPCSAARHRRTSGASAAALAGPADRARGPGLAAGSDLGRADCRHARPSQGSDGLWRRDLDGDDRRLPRLASLPDDLLPLAVRALVIALTQLVLTGRQDIAFGPYLALAAVFVIINWHRLWQFAHLHFQDLGAIIPALFAAGLLLMLGMLMLWRITKQAWYAARKRRRAR